MLSMKLFLLKSLQYYPQVFRSLSVALEIYQDIIDEYNDKLIQIWQENSVHQIHIDSWSIGHSEGHD